MYPALWTVPFKDQYLNLPAMFTNIRTTPQVSQSSHLHVQIFNVNSGYRIILCKLTFLISLYSVLLILRIQISRLLASCKRSAKPIWKLNKVIHYAAFFIWCVRLILLPYQTMCSFCFFKTIRIASPENLCWSPSCQRVTQTRPVVRKTAILSGLPRCCLTRKSARGCQSNNKQLQHEDATLFPRIFWQWCINFLRKTHLLDSVLTFSAYSWCYCQPTMWRHLNKCAAVMKTNKTRKNGWLHNIATQTVATIRNVQLHFQSSVALWVTEGGGGTR